MCRRTVGHIGLVLVGAAVAASIGYVAHTALPLILLFLVATVVLDFSAGLLALVLTVGLAAALLLLRTPSLPLVSSVQACAWIAGIGSVQLWLVWRLRRQVRTATLRAENVLPLATRPGPEHVFARLVDLAPDGVVCVDSAGYIVLFNAASERLFGYTRDEILGASVDILVPEGLVERHRAQRDTYMQEPRTRRMGAGLDLAARRKDGTFFPADISLAVIERPDSDAVLVKASVRDITERKEREEELRQEQVKREVAEQSVRDHRTLLSVVAHEIKSPISSLSGLAQLISTTLQSAPETLPPAQRQRVEQALTFLSSQAERLALLVDRTLEVARLETGRFRLDCAATDLLPLIQDQVLLAQQRTTQHTFVLDLPHTPVLITCDAIRLGQVISNIIDNALKYSPSGPITIALYPTANDVCFEVTDSGPGIPENIRPTLFKQPILPEGKYYHSGLGIGAWLSSRIVEAHGGTITAETPAGGGTRIVVCLPRSGVKDAETLSRRASL